MKADSFVSVAKSFVRRQCVPFDEARCRSIDADTDKRRRCRDPFGEGEGRSVDQTVHVDRVVRVDNNGLVTIFRFQK